MVKFYDISSWEEHLYYSTGGTRNKVVVENPQNKFLYYFKTSYKKKSKDYIYEFWSEIISSEVGSFLGLDILHYDVALRDGKLGCLSKSMIDQNNTLMEAYKWLQGFNEKYDANNKNDYTFQIIEKFLRRRFPSFIKNMITMIVFDSIIGNEDRHQENWSIIETSIKKKRILTKKIYTDISYKFAPIYDSGSSLGRELTDEKVAKMLKDKNQLNAYVNRGRSEIHWKGEEGKQKHLNLISKISNYGYKKEVEEIIISIKDKYNEKKIIDIINNIDNCLPKKLYKQKIPRTRKDFLVELLSLRFKKLFELKL